jgi:hypothetical protein
MPQNFMLPIDGDIGPDLFPLGRSVLPLFLELLYIQGGDLEKFPISEMLS